MASAVRRQVGRLRLVGALGLVAGLALVQSAPGAPQAGEAKPLSLQNDARLALPLRITAPGVSLRELLPQIAQAVGVTLSCTPELSDEKVVLFGPPRPAGATLDDLAALLDLRWERTDRNGSVAYRLMRSPAAVQRARTLEVAVTRRLQALVDAHAGALAETPEQLQRRPERDFARILLQDPELRAATQFYALLSERQKEELFRQKQLLLPLASLPPTLQTPLREVYGQRVRQEEGFFNSPEGQEALRKAGPNGRVIRHRPEDLERNAFRLQALRADGYLSVGMNLGSGPTATSVSVNDEGKSVLAVNGWPVTLVDTQALWTLPAHGPPFGATEENPDLRQKLGEAAAKMKPEGAWIERLRALAETAGTPVLADFYHGAPVNRAPAEEPEDPGASPGVRRLDRFCAEAQYLWWSRGSSLLLRKRDWMTQALYEVPEGWRGRVQERLAARSGVAWSSDLVAAGELTAAQADGLAALARGGMVSDSSDGEALRTVLVLVAAPLRLRDRPLPAERSDGTDPPLSLTLSDLSPGQRNAVAQLGPRLGWILSPEEVRAFRLQLSALPRLRNASGEYLPVRVRCDYGPTHGMQSTLYLPLAFAPDRRGSSVVEKLP
jgi:hypothetical protein